jgi:hypothetical protein
MTCIRQATAEDKAVISQLRINEFRRSTNFDLLLADKLKWSRCDDENIVLAVWNGRKAPISTMRAVVVNDTEEALACLECSVPDDLPYPAIVFNSAATRKENRRQSLNQVIRYHFLLAAVRDGIQAILSPIYLGAPRIDFMKALGYQFSAPQKSWQTKLLPKSERILGILSRADMVQAIDYLKAHRGKAIDTYPWQGELFTFPMAETLTAWVLKRKEKQPAPVIPLHPIGGIRQPGAKRGRQIKR